jgi:hypothetical protein
VAEPAKRTPRKNATAAKAKRAPAARKATAAKTPTSTAGRGVARTKLEETTVVAGEVMPAAAPPRKRAASSRPAARAAAALRGEPEPDPDAPPAAAGETLDVGSTTLIPFHGRNILVSTPTGEQLVIYRRISLQFQALEAQQNRDGGISGEDALRHMDRATRLIQSVMVNTYDREWLEDEMLMGNITLEKAADILTEAFAALKKSAAQQGNRQARRSRAALED